MDVLYRLYTGETPVWVGKEDGPKRGQGVRPALGRLRPEARPVRDGQEGVLRKSRLLVSETRPPGPGPRKKFRLLEGRCDTGRGESRGDLSRRSVGLESRPEEPQTKEEGLRKRLGVD